MKKLMLFAMMTFQFSTIGCNSMGDLEVDNIQDPVIDDPFVGELSTFDEKLTELAEQLVDPTGIDTNKTQSLVLGLVTTTGSKIYAFGETLDGRLPTGEDVYPLSSVSKALTGIIAARGVVEGDFDSDSSMSSLLNSDISNLVDQNLTLQDLASHYGGFDTMPANLDPTNPNSPASDYSRQDLIDCLDRLCSNVSLPGTQYRYSNLGSGLLSVALQDYYDYPDYEMLLRSRLTGPLNMTNTHRNTDPFNEDLITKLIPGFTTAGESADAAKMGVLDGAGGILTTGNDMLKFMKMLAQPNAQQAQFLNEATRSIHPVKQDTDIGYSIDIISVDGIVAFKKGGGQAGYGSMIMWSTELNAGVVLLSNRGHFSSKLAPMAEDILRLITEQKED